MINEKLAKLLNIKSIVTLLTTIVFCYLSVVKVINQEQFMLVFTTIIAFYFGTQASKNDTPKA